MSNTSKKRRNKKIQTLVLVALGILLVAAFIVSRKSSHVDPASFAEVEVNEPTAHVKGGAEAPLTLVEYSDFQCPACAAAAPEVSRLVEEFGDKFNLEYRHFPLRSIHGNAQLAGQAAEAAGMQGKFWEMHDLLFEKQNEWSQSFNPKRYFINYANEIGLHEDRFKFDLESDQVKEIVNAQFGEAQALQLPGTPSFVLDGERIDINEFVNTHLAPQAETSEEAEA